MSASEEPALRVVVVDDHPLFREALRSRLAAADSGLLVVGEAGTAADALDVVAREDPDVVVLDYMLPDGSGLTVAKELAELDPPVPSILVTAYDETATVAASLRAGVAGLLSKRSDGADLADRIRRVHRGELAFDDDVLVAATGHLSARPARVQLAPREQEIVALLSYGLTNDEIANKLWIRPSTVRTHLERIYDKLGVSNRTQAAYRARELGFVASGPPA